MDNRLKEILLMPFNWLYKISPKYTFKILFLLKLRKKLDLKNPKTYNEKIQWIKLYDKNPLMPYCSDKYHVRKYLQDKGLGHLLNELYWEGFNPEEIPFDNLPNKFVIKVTHGSTYNIICDNKEDLDKEKTIKLLNKWKNKRFLPAYGEWFYGILKPRIIVEKYLENYDGRLIDYKFFCFNGIPKLVYVDTWRGGTHTINAYDTDFNLYKGVKLGHPNDDYSEVKKPKSYNDMLEYAKILSKDFLHVRVDFYEVDNEVVFGELTFTKSAGFGKISPSEFDEKMGSWLKLPISKDELS